MTLLATPIQLASAATLIPSQETFSISRLNTKENQAIVTAQEEK